MTQITCTSGWGINKLIRFILLHLAPYPFSLSITCSCCESWPSQRLFIWLKFKYLIPKYGICMRGRQGFKAGTWHFAGISTIRTSGIRSVLEILLSLWCLFDPLLNSSVAVRWKEMKLKRRQCGYSYAVRERTHILTHAECLAVCAFLRLCQKDWFWNILKKKC